MTLPLTDAALSGFFQDADKASVKGQAQTLLWSRVRLFGAAIAAVGGTSSFLVGTFDLWACVALVGFAGALVAEIILATHQPERDWYAGRALAESAKTLAWRYAVGGAPFPMDVPQRSARFLMQERLAQIAEKGKDRITLKSDELVITEKMSALRSRSFAERKQTYLEGRIRDQKNWYANAAKKNKSRALQWRIALIVGETSAVALAGGRAFGAWDLDVSGILASALAGGAAWLGLKQHSALASAYSVASLELGLSYERLVDTDEGDWPQVVADAEEAISREHTMWLASRSGQR